jgi:predicted O-methyltransferase YrrM
VALPALKMVLPKLRPGAAIVVDNTISSAEGYKELFEVIRNPNGAFTSITLPYKNGLELSIYNP